MAVAWKHGHGELLLSIVERLGATGVGGYWRMLMGPGGGHARVYFYSTGVSGSHSHFTISNCLFQHSIDCDSIKNGKSVQGFTPIEEIKKQNNI